MSLDGFLNKARSQARAYGDSVRLLELRQQAAISSRWQKIILASPTEPNPEIIRSAMEGMRSLAGRRRDILESEVAAMHMLCTAIKAGAFSGPEWLAWRSRVAVNPHIINAAFFFASCNSRLSHIKIEDGNERSFSAIRIVADQLEPFIATVEQPGKTRKTRRRGRPKGTTKNDPKKDAGTYRDWKASGMTTRDFCRDRGWDLDETKLAIGRHKKAMQKGGK